MKTTTLVDEAAVGTTASTRKFFPVTFGGNVALQLATAAADKTAGGTLAGTWKVFGSNKPGADVDGDANASDITAAFTIPGSSTGIASVSSGGSSQGVQAGPLWFAYIAAIFTPSSGAGSILGYMNDAGRT
jgi:hypothetical protein